MDLGQLDKGIELLHRCLPVAPEHSHACVALAFGYQRAGDLPRAREYAIRALAADPRNPVALKNLGTINGQEGDCLRALYYKATVLRDRSPRPADRVRPRLRPLSLRDNYYTLPKRELSIQEIFTPWTPQGNSPKGFFAYCSI